MNHPDKEVAAAAADPNAGGVSPKQLAIEAAKRFGEAALSGDIVAACQHSLPMYDYIRSLPQPDPGPIDAEWLLSIGGKSKDRLDWDVSAGNDVVVFVAIGLDHDPWVYIRQDDSDCVFVRAMTDRDDLLRLIAALKGGVE